MDFDKTVASRLLPGYAIFPLCFLPWYCSLLPRRRVGGSGIARTTSRFIRVAASKPGFQVFSSSIDMCRIERVRMCTFHTLHYLFYLHQRQEHTTENIGLAMNVSHGFTPTSSSQERTKKQRQAVDIHTCGFRRDLLFFAERGSGGVAKKPPWTVNCFRLVLHTCGRVGKLGAVGLGL